MVGDAVVEAAAAEVRSRLPAGEALRPELRQQRAATIERVAVLATSWCREHLRQLQVVASEEGACPSLDLTILSDPTYLERLAHLTVERTLVFAAAPRLRLSPLPDSRLAKGLAESLAVAVVFDYPLAIAHELYPLWTDAFVTGQASGTGAVVVGVHLSWLDGACRARRLITYSAADDAFLEADLTAPLSLDAALLLAQGPATHRALSQRLLAAGVPHVNTYAGAAEAADDKWTCFERWRQGGVATPPTCLLERGMESGDATAHAASFMATCDECRAGWFVQPRHGTESEGVDWIAPGDGAAGLAAAALQRIAPGDDAILRPRVGLLRLQGAEGPRAFDLRLHVCRHAGETRTESGYLICAPTPDEPVSAVSRGASIERLGRLAAPGLCREDNSGRTVAVPWSPADRARTLEMAARAAAALDLDLAGVDVKLDLIDGSVQPVVLDANPRPAGLLHADLVVGDQTEAGVGPALWRQLTALAVAGK